MEVGTNSLYLIKKEVVIFFEQFEFLARCYNFTMITCFRLKFFDVFIFVIVIVSQC